MRTDALFYAVFQAIPAAFFELLGQSAEDSRGYQFQSVEIKEPNFRLDGVLVPPRGLAGPIYFTEVQFQKKRDFYWRLFPAIFLYYYQNRPPENWHAVAIFARRSLDPGLPVQYEALRQHLTVVYLDELEGRQDLPLGVELIRLIVTRPRQAIQRARSLLATVRAKASRTPEDHEIIEFVETILLYKFPRMTREELEAMLDLKELRNTRYYQDVYEEGKLDTVPLLLEAGFSVETIAERLNIGVAAVRKAAEKTDRKRDE